MKKNSFERTIGAKIKIFSSLKIEVKTFNKIFYQQRFLRSSRGSTQLVKGRNFHDLTFFL